MQSAGATNETPHAPEWVPRFVAAKDAWIGQRKSQQDALTLRFQDDGIGFAVLSDGMGGHASGDLASKLVVSEVAGDIEFDFQNLIAGEDHIPDFLTALASQANDLIARTIDQNPDCRGMGATLVAPVFVHDRLYWVSVGDSPFYRIRDGEIRQLNADHSMAAEIDLMVEMELLTPEAGRNHPSRNCLKSAIAGGEIKITDCPEVAETVLPGDVYVLASDGLQSLRDADICRIVTERSGEPAEAIINWLMHGVENADVSDQDNVAIAVVKAVAA